MVNKTIKNEIICWFCEDNKSVTEFYCSETQKMFSMCKKCSTLVKPGNAIEEKAYIVSFLKLEKKVKTAVHCMRCRLPVLLSMVNGLGMCPNCSDTITPEFKRWCNSLKRDYGVQLEFFKMMGDLTPEEQFAKIKETDEDYSFWQELGTVYEELFDIKSVKQNRLKLKVPALTSEQFDLLKKHNVLYVTPTSTVYNLNRLEWLKYAAGHDELRGSRMERTIEGYFKTNNIAYFKEYTIKREGKGFRYDFYLPKFKTLIEYDGQQHFSPVNFCGNKSRMLANFELQKKIDCQKNELAFGMGLNLLRIAYYENPIKKITNILLDENYTYTEQSILDFYQGDIAQILRLDAVTSQIVETYKTVHEIQENLRFQRISLQKLKDAASSQKLLYGYKWKLIRTPLNEE